MIQDLICLLEYGDIHEQSIQSLLHGYQYCKFNVFIENQPFISDTKLNKYELGILYDWFMTLFAKYKKRIISRHNINDNGKELWNNLTETYGLQFSNITDPSIITSIKYAIYIENVSPLSVIQDLKAQQKIKPPNPNSSTHNSIEQSSSSRNTSSTLGNTLSKLEAVSPLLETYSTNALSKATNLDKIVSMNQPLGKLTKYLDYTKTTRTI